MYAIMCGTDAHDKNLVNRIAADREAPEALTVANTLTGRQKLFEHLKGLRDKHGAERVILAYEASTLGFTIYDECVAAGIECYILAPTKMRKSRSDGKKKDDGRDALMILESVKAHVLAGNELPKIWIPDDQTRDDRELVRARLNAADKLAKVKTQIRSLLKRRGIVKDRGVGNPWTRSYKHWLECLELASGAQAALSSLLRQLEMLEQDVKILDKELEALSVMPRYEKPARELEGLKGIGKLTAMVFLTELGDLRRFTNRRKISAFLGVVPSTFDTGKADGRHGHITHDGPPRVRKVLCQAAWSRLQYDRRECRIYEEILRKNPKKKKIAVVALMRRLAILMWHVGLEAQVQAGVFASAVGE